MESERAEPPGSVPWRYVILDPDGRRHVGERWARPSASAADIAEELLAFLAHQVWQKHGSFAQLAACVAVVRRDAHDGWPAQYGEAHGITWLEEAVLRSQAT